MVAIVLSSLVTVFTSVQSFFEFKSTSEAHKELANGFSIVSSTIRAQLVLDPQQRTPAPDLQKELSQIY